MAVCKCHSPTYLSEGRSPILSFFRRFRISWLDILFWLIACFSGPSAYEGTFVIADVYCAALWTFLSAWMDAGYAPTPVSTIST
jgi:hypothetical protein